MSPFKTKQWAPTGYFAIVLIQYADPHRGDAKDRHQNQRYFYLQDSLCVFLTFLLTFVYQEKLSALNIASPRRFENKKNYSYPPLADP